MAEPITYADKETFEEKPTIPANKKGRAVDWNEIKTKFGVLVAEFNALSESLASTYRPVILEQDSYFETTREGYTDYYEEIFEEATGESWWANYYVDEFGSLISISAGNNSETTQGRAKLSLGPTFGGLEFDGNASLPTHRVRATKDGTLTRGKQYIDTDVGNIKNAGLATLVAGTVTISSNLVTANSLIFLSIQSLGTVAAPKAIAVTARVASTSFTITSEDVTDTSVIAWEIKEII